uniref:Cas1_AcylT domain-containing protein n=2 Tax=Caenorhabditis tropicalis TaxID=1561998 RepID=A0A1I7UGK1_9PELO
MDHGKTGPKNPSAFNITSYHLLGSFCMLFITSYIFQVEEEKLTKRRSLFIGCVTIFHIFYLFNPWIAEYQKDAEEVFQVFHYTVKLHSTALYCCLVIAAFICWLPWQNQSTRKKPKYKVIYGDEDSVTKKLLDDYSV